MASIISNAYQSFFFNGLDYLVLPGCRVSNIMEVMSCEYFCFYIIFFCITIPLQNLNKHFYQLIIYISGCQKLFNSSIQNLLISLILESEHIDVTHGSHIFSSMFPLYIDSSVSERNQYFKKIINRHCIVFFHLNNVSGVIKKWFLPCSHSLWIGNCQKAFA